MIGSIVFSQDAKGRGSLPAAYQGGR